MTYRCPNRCDVCDAECYESQREQRPGPAGYPMLFLLIGFVFGCIATLVAQAIGAQL